MLIPGDCPCCHCMFFACSKKTDMETEAHGPGILSSLLLTGMGWDRGEHVAGGLNLPCGAKMQMSLVPSLSQDLLGCISHVWRKKICLQGCFMRH